MRTVRWPCCCAYFNAASSPLYSATLLVDVPRKPLNSLMSVPVFVLDAHAIAGGPGIAAGAAVDIGDDGHLHLGDGRRGFGAAREIEDSATAVALDDGLVLPDFVEHLRAKTHVADRAQPVARFGDGDALPALGGRFENARGHARSISATSFSRSARGPVDFRLQAGLSVSSTARSAAISFSAAFSSASLFLMPALSSSDFHHDLEDAILARADVVLRGLDLVEHRGVFAVGLHLEQLVLVFREPCLHRRRPLSLRRAAFRRRPRGAP